MKEKLLFLITLLVSFQVSAEMSAADYRLQRQNRVHIDSDDNVTFQYPTVRAREIKFEPLWFWMNREEANKFCQLFDLGPALKFESYKPTFPEDRLAPVLREQANAILTGGAGHVEIGQNAQPALEVQRYGLQVAQAEGIFDGVKNITDGGVDIDERFESITCSAK